MRGQVIDGLYKGCSVIQQENSTFCIRDADGGCVYVNQNTAHTVADISHNYPGFGAKTYMIRWKQDAVSVVQLFPDRITPETETVAVPADTPRKSRLPLILGVLALILVIGLGAVWKSGALHRHSWVDATCQAPRTCSGCGETQGDPLEHIPGQWTVGKKATYGSWGTQNQNCQLCGTVLAQQPYLPDAYVGDLYVCSTDEFQHRLNLWLKEGELPYTTTLVDEAGEMLCIHILDGQDIRAVVCFVDRNYVTIYGDGPGRINASSVGIAFEVGNTQAEEDLLPVLVASCNNSMDLSTAREVVAEVRAQRKLEREGLRYIWGTADGLDYLFLGFDAVPDSLRELPSLPSETDAVQQETQSILYTSAGTRRNAAEFANTFITEALPISREFGYGELKLKSLPESDCFAFGLYAPGAAEHTVLAFGNEEDLLYYNAEFSEIYLISPSEPSEQLDAFAFHSAAMVHLVDPSMGDLNACARFLDTMIEEMGDETSSLKEVNGFTYYMSFRDDGYVCLVISF